MPESLQDWLCRFLVCPADRERFARHGDSLTCASGHSYPMVGGIPVLLTEKLDPTHPYCSATLDALKTHAFQPVSDSGLTVDPFVQDEIIRTNGNLYRRLRGHLSRYPIPQMRLPPGNGKVLLDVGCNWGRWTFAAARAGYRAIGIDPWIEAVRAGQRVARQLSHDVGFVVGDARCLPFADSTFDIAFSYSVLQHFDKSVARTALAEMARATVPGGIVLVQMPNVFGIRQACNLVRQRVQGEENPFRVRYWRPRELLRTFQSIIGPSKLDVDGYFSLNPQAADLDLLPSQYAWIVRASEAFRAVSRVFPPLKLVADSLYVESRNSAARRDNRAN